MIKLRGEGETQDILSKLVLDTHWRFIVLLAASAIALSALTTLIALASFGLLDMMVGFTLATVTLSFGAPAISEVFSELTGN